MIPATPVRVRFAPARPVFSTSAVREPRSSTGSSHVTRAARSCSDRGHGRRALHRGDDPGDPRGSGVARHRLGRRAVLPVQARRPPPGGGRDARGAGGALMPAFAPWKSWRRSGSGDRAEGILRVQRAMSRHRRRRGARRVARPSAHTIRFAVPPGETAWEDVVHGHTSFENRTIGDFIVVRSTGRRRLQPRGHRRRPRRTDHARGPRRRSHLEHAQADPDLPRARSRAPVFAHVPLILGPTSPSSPSVTARSR